MRIVAAFLLLTVFAGLAVFLTFTSSWGSLLVPHTTANEAAIVEEIATATPNWEGKFAVDVNQSVVLRSDPFAAAPTVGLLRKGDKVALQGCDPTGLWCQTEDGAWLVSYMIGTLPANLPVLGGVVVPVAKNAPTPIISDTIIEPTATPTEVPIALFLPTPTPVPSVPPQALVTDAANLRAGPGTTFAIVGSAGAGETLNLAGQSADGEWFQTDSGAWIAAFLLSEPPAGLPVIAGDSGQTIEAEAAPLLPSAPDAAVNTTIGDIASSDTGEVAPVEPAK